MQRIYHTEPLNQQEETTDEITLEQYNDNMNNEGQYYDQTLTDYIDHADDQTLD